MLIPFPLQSNVVSIRYFLSTPQHTNNIVLSVEGGGESMQSQNFYEGLQVIHPNPCGNQQFVSCLKANSCEEEKEILSGASADLSESNKSLLKPILRGSE